MLLPVVGGTAADTAKVAAAAVALAPTTRPSTKHAMISYQTALGHVEQVATAYAQLFTLPSPVQDEVQS